MERRNDTVDAIYAQRNRMMIIGLTGRTGSGCSKVAEILSANSLEEMDLSAFKTRDFTNADERKHAVIRKFLNKDKRWKKFVIIEASSIILSFLLERNADDLFSFIDELNSKGNTISDIQALKGQLTDFGFCNEDSGSKIRRDIVKYSNILFNANFNSNREEDKENTLSNSITFFTIELKKYKNKFKEILDKYYYKHRVDGKLIESNLYSYLMQCFGNNIRASGDVFECEYSSGSETKVAERINLIIKLINKSEDENGKEVIRICIDAFRNPFEIHYFRDR